MSRPRHSPPVRRPPLPFELGDEMIHGAVFQSGGRWMAVATDELTHAIAEELRALPAPVRDPVATVLGRAMVRWLN